MRTDQTAHPEPANDIRHTYCPRPDRRVRRALRQLLNENDPHRRGEIAGWMVFALVVVLVLAGARW
jgi:hypothetical protein